MPTFTDLLAPRIAARIDTGSDPVGGCWYWLGSHDRYGYGKAWIAGRDLGVHRYVYAQIVGPIPDGMQIDHLCRVRGCCNPEHMEVVDVATNVLRGTGRAAQNARKVECPRGHPFEQGAGQRICRTCRREAGRRYDARNRAKRARAEALRRAQRKAM